MDPTIFPVFSACAMPAAAKHRMIERVVIIRSIAVARSRCDGEYLDYATILADEKAVQRFYRFMQNIEIVKEKNAVLVPLKKWEKLQKELVRLRRKVNKDKVLQDLRDAIIRIESDIENGRKPKGRDAREFITELMNAK